MSEKSTNKPKRKTTSGKTFAKKSKKITINKAIVNVHVSFNNTIVSVANEKGESIVWSSGGTLGYKGFKKSTAFVAQQAAAKCAKFLKDNNINEVSVITKGIGPGREAAIRGFQSSGIVVLSIKDCTPTPFNGCRRPKQPNK